MNAASRARTLENRKRRIRYRLRERRWKAQKRPMFRAKNVHYEVAGRIRALAVGGMGAIHGLARQTGLIQAIDERLKLLKIHLPYHESDHVLNIAYNIVSGGTCLEDLELLTKHTQFLGPGLTFCALAPGAMEPLQSALKYFREDFERHISEKRCPWK